MTMAVIKKESVQEYLSQLYKSPAEVIEMNQIGTKASTDMKSFGYGKPFLVRFLIEGKTGIVVLETMAENSFGHDHFSVRLKKEKHIRFQEFTNYMKNRWRPISLFNQIALRSKNQ